MTWRIAAGVRTTLVDEQVQAQALDHEVQQLAGGAGTSRANRVPRIWTRK